VTRRARAASSPHRLGQAAGVSARAPNDELRDAGVEAPPEQRERQLRELNEISRQPTPPGTPVPAPEVDRSGR
jgi:hypothetical protein